MFVKNLETRMLRAIEKVHKEISNSVFRAGFEQFTINKAWDHALNNEQKIRY